MKKTVAPETDKLHTPDLSRRAFIRRSGAVAALAGIVAGQATPSAGQEKAQPSAANEITRRDAALKLRRDAAQAHFDEIARPFATNGDEKRYADQRGSFSKTLPHNDHGEVAPQAYAEFVSILGSGDAARFEQFPRDPQAQSKLSSPMASYAFEIVGSDAHSVPIPPPPAFASAEIAFEMGELYWQMLTLDVPYTEYNSSPLIQAAAADLNSFSSRVHPLADGKITPLTLFRGDTAGDLAGPYISQFLWMDIPYGMKTIDQRYVLPHRGQTFLTKGDEWLAIQKGMRPKARMVFDDTPRYLANNRDLAEWVHQDFSFQAALNAALIIQRWGDEAQSPGNPYRSSKTQAGGVTLGREALTFLGSVATASQKACYYHKWLVHRRARPEAFAGKVDNHLGGYKSYDIHSDLLRCEGLARSYAAHGTRLLPQSYPEGSPVHPSYPAGHATNVGAGTTLLKAFFNESLPVPKPVQANADGSALAPYTGPPLTLGHELNKLAHNVSLGRDAGGVHYRSDGVQGMLLGETLTISVLCDYSRTYRERFDGFTLTRLDGQKIRIRNGSVALL